MTNTNSTTGSTGPTGSGASVSNTAANQHVVSRDASVDSGSSLLSLQIGHTNARSDDARMGQALSDEALSTIADDGDTIINAGNELLEFDFDSDVQQPLAWNGQASMTREIKMLQKRLFEATRLSLTMPGDSTLASNASALKRQWGQFKHKIKAKYSSSEADETKAALAKLKTLTLDNCENLEDFIHRFNALKLLAGVTENATMVHYLSGGLDIDIYTSVSTETAQARGTKGKKKRRDKELNARIRNAVKAYQRSEGSYSSSHSNRSHQKKTRRAGGHYQTQYNKNTSKEQVLKCYDCGFTPFTYAHEANCKKNPKNMKKTSKKRSKTIVPKPASDNNTDTSSSDEEGDQTFTVATISNKGKDKEQVVSMDTDTECKYLSSEDFKKMPSINMNTNGLLHLPVILESRNGVRVNTWFLLDTGCTCSDISSQLVNFMNLDITKLAQNNSMVERRRQTEEELNTDYGSKIV